MSDPFIMIGGHAELIQPGDPMWTVVKHPEGWRYHWFSPCRIVTGTLRVPIRSHILSRDEEIFFEDGEYFKINHERQVKSLYNERKLHLLLYRQKYWEYIVNYPAHLSKSQVQRIVQRGGREALDYLKWCTQLALLPAKAPTTVFSLERSKELTELLNNVMECYVTVDGYNDIIWNASEQSLPSLVLKHKQSLTILVSKSPDNSTTHSGDEKASYLLKQNIELGNHLSNFFDKLVTEKSDRAVEESIMLSVYKALITPLHQLVFDGNRPVILRDAAILFHRNTKEFRQIKFADSNKILPSIRSIQDKNGMFPIDTPSTTRNLTLLTKELVTLLVGCLVMERDLVDNPSIKAMFSTLITRSDDGWTTHNFLQNVPELVTFINNIDNILLPDSVEHLQAMSMELLDNPRSQKESFKPVINILSKIADNLHLDVEAASAERRGRMSANMASVNDGLVTALYHLIDKTNTEESTYAFMVEYLHELEWELFTDHNEGPNLRSTVPVSVIAGILTQKYRSYNARCFWEVDRNEFPEWSRSKAGGTDNIFAQFLTCGCSYFLMVLCLFAPQRYSKIISEVDSLFLTGDEWRSHVQKLTDDWSAFNLLSTVILAAAVSYLSAQNLGPVAKIAVLISILCALGSVLVGLYCLAYYRTYTSKVDGTNNADVDRFIGNLTDHGKNRPRYFAIILSLPEVFLVWSIVSFTVTTLAFNFSKGNQPTPGGSLGVLGVLIVLAIGFGLMIFALWYIWGQGSLMSRVRRTFSKKKTVETTV